MSRLSITLPSAQNTMPEIAEMARIAEDAGFDSAFHWELYRSPYMGLAAAAATTSRITLGTGIAQAFTRSPFVTANQIADLDELSGGRAILGLGPSDPMLMATFHGRETDVPLAQLREYVAVVRRCWEFLNVGECEPYEGRHYGFYTPFINPFGGRKMVRPSIPLYLAGFRPRSVRLAGEIADGVMGALWSPEYIAQVVQPNVVAGAERAGRDPAEVDISAQVICCVSEDREVALRRARIQVGMYVALPVSDEIIQFHGLEKEQEKLREAYFNGNIDGLADATDDALLDVLAIAGTPDECRAKFKEYERVLPHIVLHTPYVPPLTGEESFDALRKIAATFGPA